MSLGRLVLAGSGTTEETDDSFNLVTSLYHFDGSNGAQNNTYVDSSSTSKTLTCSSNLAQGTFSPFSSEEGKWSVLFEEDNSDFLSFDNSDFSFGTGDYTVECFVFFTGNDTTSGGIFQTANSGTTTAPAMALRDTTGLTIYTSSGQKITGNNGTFTLGVWYHLAFVRASNVVKVYKDGSLVAWDDGTTSVADTTNITGTGFAIGRYYSNDYTLDGFISNFRVTKSAVYTGAFSKPTTPLTDITNTVLLTCRENRFRDASSEANTVSIGAGTPKIQPFSPFAPSASYDSAVNGGSANWPIEADKTNKITLSSSADFAFGTGAFTIEAWVYVTADTNPYSRVWHVGPFWNNNNAIGLVVNDTASSDKTAFCVYAAGGRTCVSTNPTPKNEWFHVACVRHATGYFELFINGTSNSSNTAYSTTNISPGGNQTLAIGNIVETNSTLEAEACFEGFISNLRVVQGTAIYSAGSSFTVPTAPVTDVTNTKLLANFTNAAMFDQTGKTNTDTVGNAQLDTSVKKFGTASAEFDGTGDYLTISQSSFVPLGSSNFTIEGWVYFDFSPTDGQGLFQLSNGYLNSQVRGPAVGCSAGNGKWGIYHGTTWLEHSSLVPSGTTWYHFAFVRNSGTSKFYIDGTEILSASDSTNYTDTYFTIGGWYSTSYLLSGYIDEFRISLKARYTSNFQAPTKEFPNR